MTYPFYKTCLPNALFSLLSAPPNRGYVLKTRPLALILIFGWFCFIGQNHASKIVLLTSLDPEENRPPLRLKSWNINEKLEKRFHKELWKFPFPLEKKVVHFATADDLYDTLKDPEVSAIVWVGHAGFADSNGLGSLRSIVDYKGRDLKSLFQAVAPHLKYLALVGCRGKLFLNEWQTKGYFKHTPELTTYGREVRTDARKGLKLAMRNLKDLLYKRGDFLANSKPSSSQYLAHQDSSGQYIEVTVERSNLKDNKLDSLQILQKNRLVGFLPSGEENGSFLFKKSQSLRDLKIVADSGHASSSKDTNLGILSITTTENIEWKLFQTPNGKPIGVGRHIYRPKFIRPNN